MSLSRDVDSFRTRSSVHELGYVPFPDGVPQWRLDQIAEDDVATDLAHGLGVVSVVPVPPVAPLSAAALSVPVAPRSSLSNPVAPLSVPAAPHSSGEKQLDVDGVEVAPASGEKFISWKDPGVWLFTVQTIFCQKPYIKKAGSNCEEQWFETGKILAKSHMMQKAGLVALTGGSKSRDKFNAVMKQFQKKTSLSSNVSGHVSYTAYLYVYIYITFVHVSYLEM